MTLKTRNIIMALTLIAVIVIGNVCAYFTDAETATNKFTVGNVDITLTEPNFDATKAQGLAAGATVAKDPTVTNVGINDAYVYIKLYMPKAKVETAKEDGTRNPIALMEIFTYYINENWTQLSKDDTSNSAYNIYVYAYNSKLSKNEKTTPLFSEVTIVNLTTEHIPLEYSTYIINPNASIGVFAYAIQSDGTGTAAEAWEKYCNQNPDIA